jgi:hypothetical protein
MKMYTDGVVEGTPEEVAAFKHIDAALMARNKRSSALAIEAPKRKAAVKKVAPQRKNRKGASEQVLKLVGAKGGVTSGQVAEYMELPHKTAYNLLYRMVQSGEIVRNDGLYHRVPQNVNGVTA